MKPLMLEMTAFSSYADTVRVPFAELRHGLYLVAGDTGAGKTTIFDAVVFALFGKASGRDRTPAMLHSDYVDKSVDTVVMLRFEEGGKEYTVHRSIHFPKKKGTEGGFGDQQIGALLEEPDREPTEGSERVTRRVETLLGLNAEQFRKIVMLAQGEFREFLKADSDKKNEILGKLFDNSAYLRYQNLLSGARDELAKRRGALREELRQLMCGVFRMPEGLSAEEAEGLLPEHPALADRLRSLTEREEASLSELGRERDETRLEISELDRQKGAAEALNARFAALEALRAELSALEGRREEMRRRSAALERAETAFHRVRPALEKRQRAEQAKSESDRELQRQRLAAENCRKALELAEAAAGEDEQKRLRLRELELELQQLDRQIRALGELEQTRKEREQVRRELEEKEARLRELQQRCAEQERRLRDLRCRLEELEEAPARVLQCQGDWERTAAREEALGALQGEIRTLSAEREALREEEERLSRLAGEALAAEETYHSLYRGFLAGQAGLMAQELRREIARHGEASCPVCGSRVGPGEEEAFALCAFDVPDQAKVDKAKQALDRAEEERSGQDKRLEARKARLHSRLESLLQEAGKQLPGCGSWEQLNDGRIPAALAREREEKKRIGAALEQAKGLEQERQRLRMALTGLEQALQQAQSGRDELSNGLQELRARGETLEALIRERAGKLPFPDAAGALTARETMRKEKTGLETALEQSRRRLEEARTGRDTALGALREKEELDQRREKELLQTGEDLEKVLAETGFADRRQALAAMPPAEAGDPLSWLGAEKEALLSWETERSQKALQLRKQEESLAGQEPVDLAALLERLQEANDRYSRCAEAWGRQENLLSNHRQVLARVLELKSALEHSDRGWKRLERLGSLAVGMNSEGGRLSFDRYVMGSVFREILEMANRRMDTMSGGRYQLIHRSGADRRNAKAGLEIQVLDLSTGQLRGSESLSGGEGFFTSLALALGLADVVQSRSGGKNLDALFIDEGFGSLSGGVLDKALEVLSQLSEGKRLVGIISHVEQLEESIPQKIRVKSGERGSSLRMELA